MHLVQQRRIRMFHETWAPGHNSTDYEHYYTANPGEMYKVTQFQSSYEPYTIFRKDGPPWCAQPPSLLVCMTLTLCRNPSIGATSDSLDMAGTKPRVCSRCISREFRSMFFPIIS